MKISNRISSNLFFIALLITIVGVFTIKIANNINSIRNIELPKEEELREIEVGLWATIQAANSYRVTAEKKYKVLYDKHTVEVDRAIERYKLLSNSKDDIDSLRNLEKKWNEAKKTGLNLISLSLSQKTEEKLFYESINVLDDIIDFDLQAKWQQDDPYLLKKEILVREVEVSLWEAIHAAHQHVGLSGEERHFYNYYENKQFTINFDELMESNFKEVNTFWEDYKELVSLDWEQKAIGQFDQIWKNAQKLGRDVIKSNNDAEMQFNKLFEIISIIDLFIKEKLHLSIKEEIDAKNDSAQELKRITFIIICIALLVALLVGFSLARVIAKPLASMVEATKKIAHGDYDLSIESSSVEEISVLAKALANMGEGLKLRDKKLNDAKIKAEELVSKLNSRSKELITMQERFHVAIDGSNDGLWDWDIKNDNVWYSRRFRELLEMSDEEFPDGFQSFEKALHPEDKQRIMKDIENHLEDDVPYDVEYRLMTKSQEYKWFRARGKARRDFSGKAYRMSGSLQDISDKKRTLFELEIERERAYEAAKAKSDFLANMSHEIRTPMNAILGFSELLGNTKLDDKQSNYIHSVQTSGKLLIGIIDDILDISKLESGKITLEKVDINLEKLIHDIFQMVVTRMKDKPFETYVDIDEDVPLALIGDPTRIQQIFVNLLGNAIKFTSKGEIGVLVKLAEEQPKNGKIALVCTVKDSGVGIATDKVNKIFESFTQEDETTTRKFGGTGLGLTITKALVETMGGDIWVESELGKGSEFKFTLQLEKSEKPLEPHIDLNSQKHLKNKTIFIVDDNQSSLKIIERCCKAIDLKVIGMSKSPHEALHKLDKVVNTKGVVPDIVLSDIMMDGMNGYEMIEKIKSNEKFKDTLFIAVTADITAETNNDPENQKFNAYVTKPISLDAMIFAFNSALSENVVGEVTEEDEEVKPCEGIKVFVVEDVITNQMLIDEYFKQLGCSVEFANNGQEAVDKLKENADYDICLMDLQMPVMGGVEATKIIREEISEDLPVVALTAAVLEEDKRKARKAGMNDFLAKPIDVQKLKECILKFKKA